VPTGEDLFSLIVFLSGEDLAGAKLKETGVTYWLNPNVATNESGFSGLGSGYRNYSNGVFYDIGNQGTWWFNYLSQGIYGRTLVLYNGSAIAYSTGGMMRGSGLSIRCLKN
jgi:uncharacterized protein (TIGR02145 family)